MVAILLSTDATGLVCAAVTPGQHALDMHLGQKVEIVDEVETTAYLGIHGYFQHSPLLHRPGRLGRPDPIPKLNLHAPGRLDTYIRCRGNMGASHRAFHEPERETGMRTFPGLPIREVAWLSFHRNRQQ